MPTVVYRTDINRESRNYEYNSEEWQDLLKIGKDNPLLFRCVDPNCNGRMIAHTRTNPEPHQMPHWWQHAPGERSPVDHTEFSEKSQLHENLQYAIREDLLGIGIHSILEQRLELESGIFVRADIFVPNEKENLSIELQLTRQTPLDYSERTEKYLKTKIDRTVWLSQDHNEAIRKVAPFVQIVDDDGDMIDKNDLEIFLENSMSLFVDISFWGTRRPYATDPMDLIEFLRRFISGSLLWKSCPLSDEDHWHNDKMCAKRFKWEQDKIEENRRRIEEEKKKVQEELQRKKEEEERNRIEQERLDKIREQQEKERAEKELLRQEELRRVRQEQERKEKEEREKRKKREEQEEKERLKIQEEKEQEQMKILEEENNKIEDIDQLMMTGWDKTNVARYEKVYSRLLRERMMKVYDKLGEEYPWEIENG